MGLTASFLPKPVVGVNGSGMHTNVSVTKDGKNMFWDPKGEEKMSKFAWQFVDRILTHGNDICLLLNPSVNAYRRLDPHFEAPNQIKASAVDRGSMIRIPIGNERSSRVEVRSVAPDANPYMVMLSVFKTGLDGDTAKIKNLRGAERYLPDNIYDALANFKAARVDDDVAGRRREGALRGPEAGIGGPLPAAAGNLREGAGSAVPPRSLQSVPLEYVLELAAYTDAVRTVGDRVFMGEVCPLFYRRNSCIEVAASRRPSAIIKTSSRTVRTQEWQSEQDQGHGDCPGPERFPVRLHRYIGRQIADSPRSPLRMRMACADIDRRRSCHRRSCRCVPRRSAWSALRPDARRESPPRLSLWAAGPHCIPGPGRSPSGLSAGRGRGFSLIAIASFFTIWLTRKCLPMSRRKSSADRGSVQSRLLTKAAGLAPSQSRGTGAPARRSVRTHCGGLLLGLQHPFGVDGVGRRSVRSSRRRGRSPGGRPAAGAAAR